VIALSSMREALPGISVAHAHHGRTIETWHDVERREFRFYDHDYGVELGTIKEDWLPTASRADAIRMIREACHEPTSLEILYYAQIGGPHVRGEA
jgi:hypothetical protein